MRLNLDKIISSFSELFDGKQKNGSRKNLEENFKKLIKQTEILQSTVQRLTGRMESIEKLSNRINSQLSDFSKSQEDMFSKSITGDQSRDSQGNQTPEKEKIGENGHNRFKIKVKR